VIPDSIWKSLFAPTSVAVIGASNKFGTWGERITKNLLSTNNRPVYLVNPSSPEIMGRPTYKSLADITEPIDLACIVVRSDLVIPEIKECIRKNIKAALIIAGGFGETGEEGAKAQAELIEIARKGGMYFIGPNTMGHMETYSGLNTISFISTVNPGPAALIAQSGNMGARIMQYCMGNGIGFNRFVCCGNEASIKLEDYLEYFARDEGTRVLLLYIEGLRDARRFLEVARKITPRKPIVVMKAGGTASAARASRSHTGALAGSDAVYSAAFKQAGVIRVYDDEELCDVAIALLNQPLPRGDRVGILTMGGGLGVVAAEACEKEGLTIADLEPSTIERLDAILPARWSRGNPVDLVGSNVAHSAEIFSTLWILLEDKNLDAVISNTWMGRMDSRHRTDVTSMENDTPDQGDERVRQFCARVKQYGIPFMMVGSPPQSAEDVLAYRFYHKEGFSVFPQPARAARTLKHLNWYRKFLESHE
jgi:acetyl-CoA synthetase (ADP-forming)